MDCLVDRMFLGVVFLLDNNADGATVTDECDALELSTSVQGLIGAGGLKTDGVLKYNHATLPIVKPETNQSE